MFLSLVAVPVVTMTNVTITLLVIQTTELADVITDFTWAGMIITPATNV